LATPEELSIKLNTGDLADDFINNYFDGDHYNNVVS
jgi:hypothetical protein